MQELTTNSYITGEQHKELSISRVSRDEADLVTVATKLDRFTPFSDDKSLCRIITGVIANETVNVHDLFTIGNDVVKNMNSHSVFLYSHKRSSKEGNVLFDDAHNTQIGQCYHTDSPRNRPLCSRWGIAFAPLKVDGEVYL